MNKPPRAWALSLMAIGLSTVAAAAFRLLPGSVPDWAMRLAGLVDLAALPVLAYTTVKWLRAGAQPPDSGK